jgi:hypothetical protein
MPCPALMNVICLWSYFLSESPKLSQQELMLLERAESAYRDALGNPSRIVETIQSAWLLSTYLFSIGRRSEAAIYISCAAQMAQDYLVTSISAEPTLEEGRIALYWLTYYLEKVGFATQPLFPNALDVNCGITMPLPLRVGDYPLFLAIMASSLFERAYNLSRAPPFAQGDAFVIKFNQVQSRIQRLSREHPLSAINTADRRDKPALIAIQSLMHAATIYLYLPFDRDDLNAWSVQAARGCVRIAQMACEAHLAVAEDEVWFIDPVVEASFCLSVMFFFHRSEISSPSCAGLVLQICSCGKCRRHGQRRT